MVLDAGIPKTVDNTLLNESQEVSAIGYQPHIINSAQMMGQTTNHSWLQQTADSRVSYSDNHSTKPGEHQHLHRKGVSKMNEFDTREMLSTNFED